MKREQSRIPENIVNHIANITIVDSFLNKGEIKDKAPALYMRTYYDNNRDIIQTMKTHLIEELDEFGVFENNYSVFFEKRIKAISNALQKEMMLTEHDKVDN